MKENFLAPLIDEIRDEALERFITERRILELQIEDLREQARRLQCLEAETGRRLGRLAYWLVRPEMRVSLLRLLEISDSSLWRKYVEGAADDGIHFIQVSGWTDKTKMRRILIELYRQACQGMARYKAAYEHLSAECEAVNSNIRKFHNNSELLTVLAFIRGLDVCAAEKERFLGSNFTARELASVDEALSFHLIRLDCLGVFPPLALSGIELIGDSLTRLADEVHRLYRNEVKHLIRMLDVKQSKPFVTFHR